MSRIRGVNSLIKRFPLPGVKRELVTESGGWDNEVESYTFSKIVVDECTIQRPKPRDLQILPQGLSIDKVFVIYTNTNIHAAIDGTNNLGMSVWIPDEITGVWGDTTNTTGSGGWYTVVSASPHTSEVIEHVKAFLVKDTTITDDKGVVAYPQTDIDAIATQIDTKDKLRSKSWVTPWLS